ncbi:MAG: glycosyltransferase [Acetobacteraceae bacterium]|nr:glycosyltransferase [Acetobacteraceae bacterium]
MTPLLLSVFPTFAMGGAQSRFVTLANHFGPAWRHAIVAMDGEAGARERLDPRLQVTFPDVGIRKGDTIGNVRRFRGALRTLRPAALLTHNFGSIEWAMANRLRLVHHVHVEDGFGPEERHKQIRRRVWLRRVFLRGRTVALPSRNLMRIASEIWRLPPETLRYVPNGIDLNRFTGPPTTQPWPGTGPVIGTVTALRPEKNLARLMRAFHIAAAAIPARLVLIGDGIERPALEQLAHNLGIADRVLFTGHISDPAPLITALDVFALSSDTEQMPMSLLEAMAAGLPAAATDVGDIKTMLAEPGRRFVTALDDAALGQALAELIRSPELRLEIGAANRAKAEREFNQDTMFRAWADLLAGPAPY